MDHFYQIDNRDDELSWSSTTVMASEKVGSAMTLHCTENLHSCGAQTHTVHTAVCPTNHLAITAVTLKKIIMTLKKKL